MEAPEIKEIVNNFAEERDVLIQLLSISERKKAFIIGGNVKKLGGLLEDEGVLSDELSELEEKRAVLTDALAEWYGCRDRKMTLAQIADMTEDPEIKEKLLAVRAELNGILRKQKRYNKANQELLKRKKSYIDVMLGVLMQEEPIGDTYDSTGCVGNRYRNAGLFDQSV